MRRMQPGEKRASIRFNKVFRVGVSNAEFGETQAIARNISTGGMQLETPSPLPLGTEVMVHFHMADCSGSIVARAEVKNHYAFNYCEAGAMRWARGMGVRFVEFLDDGAEVLRMSLADQRTLH